MKKIRLLIVEDEDREISLWQQQIERFNTSPKYNIFPQFAKNVEEAKEKLFLHKFDGAIIDIRLDSHISSRETEPEDGNDLREKIADSEVLITAHITGEPGRVTHCQEGGDDLFKVFVKADVDESDKTVHEIIIDWIISKENMIEAISDSKSIIKKQVAKLFFSSIWPRWKQWTINQDGKEEFVAKSLSRHISSHLYNELLDESDGKVHPEERYFIPPKEERFRTGDIVRHNDGFHIIVTPRCDLERQKEGEFVILTELEDISESWHKECEALDEKLISLKAQQENAKNNEQLLSIQKKIDSANNEFRVRFYGHYKNKTNLHFLPAIPLNETETIGPCFVNFSRIASLEYDSEKYRYAASNKVAMLASEFLPELSQRLGAYISRIGSPDYSHVY